MEMYFVGALELEYSRMVDFSRIIMFFVSTLYTTIHHSDFKKCIDWLLVKVFRQSQGKN